jgi:N6-L-threonylcarbamoyladenine synthase
VKSNLLICAIESSCDDTSAAVLKGRQVLSNIVADQKVHQKYGGVVPELASRAHQKHIVPVVDQALKEAGILYTDLDAIAYTKGPGLMGSLLVGASFARGMAVSCGIPAIGIHHMRAHILAHFIEDAHPAPPEFPFICLTVSGGHTQLVQVNGEREMKLIGQTLDDAAGEAFDKAAKMLGLPYPGGPQLDLRATQGDPNAFSFAKPRIDGLDMSFSGLKTSILYFLQKMEREQEDFIATHLNDLCASIQKTIVDILIEKTRKAAEQTGITQIAVAGGVSANSGLRQRLMEMSSEEGWQLYVPPLAYCTDNAAMIGICAALDAEAGHQAEDGSVHARSIF